MPLRHVVLLKLRPEATGEQRAALERGLAGLPEAIPEIDALSFGQDAGLDPERNHDFSIVANFDSEAEYQVYAAHPAHQKVIQELVKPILAPGGRVAVQYHHGPVPGAPAEILEALKAFRASLAGGQAVFADTMAFVADHFNYTPRRFYNGGSDSVAGTNEGSCKALSLGKLVGLSKQEVLLSFGEHYREVCGNPSGTTHGNIRSFMKHGWDGVHFPDGLGLAFASEEAAAKRQKVS